MSATSLLHPVCVCVLGLSSAVCNTPPNHHSAWLQPASLKEELLSSIWRNYIGWGGRKSRQTDSCEMDYIYVYTYAFLCCLFSFSGHWKRWAVGTQLCNIISPCRDAWLYHSEAKSQQHFSETLLKSSEAESDQLHKDNTTIYLIPLRDCLWLISQHSMLHYVFVLQG